VDHCTTHGLVTQPRVTETRKETLMERKPALNIVPGTIDPAAVRKWAAENGWKVGDRGRFSQALIDAYVAVNGAPSGD
jgi:hypothetical protein